MYLGVRYKMKTYLGERLLERETYLGERELERESFLGERERERDREIYLGEI